jgi:hypothetical protein
MRNNLIIALCCITLFAVVADLFLIHSRTAYAQTQQIFIKRVPAADAQVFILGDNVVGFSCAPINGVVECFIASRNAPQQQN